jgi:hypothetical protein
MDLLKELATSAKEDGDTKGEWLSTLKSHLIILFQQGKLPVGTDVNQMMRDAPEAWGHDDEEDLEDAE